MISLAAPDFAFILKGTLAPEVTTPELGVSLADDVLGGVIVTSPVNPPARLMLTVTFTFFPRLTESVEEFKLTAKSGISLPAIVFAARIYTIHAKCMEFIS